jgi:AraC-like DNA-binding protein
MIMDPHDSFSDTSLDEMKIYDYIYVLKDFVEKLGYNQRVVYLQSIRNSMTEDEISDLLGLSQSYISRIKNRLMGKALKLWNKIDNSRIDHTKADKFALALLGPETDDELSDKLDCSLAVIKVCREVLSIANLYSGNEARIWA